MVRKVETFPPLTMAHPLLRSGREGSAERDRPDGPRAEAQQ
jgi:hypothetical protein